MLVAALLLAAAVLTATAQEARAARDPWPTRHRCGAGSFDLGSVTSRTSPRYEGVIDVTVRGQLTCDVPVEGATFALAVYWVGSPLGWIDVPHALMPYASRTGPHPFVAQGGISVSEPSIICVLSDLDLRLACIELRRSLQGFQGTVTTRVVSPSDKMVDTPVRFLDIGVDPGCGTCWSVRP